MTIEAMDPEMVLRRLNAHLIHHLEFAAEHPVEPIPRHQLIVPGRFDLAAKNISARSRLTVKRTEWTEEVYREHLRVWGGFLERDGSGKDDFAKYRSAFDRLITDRCLHLQFYGIKYVTLDVLSRMKSRLGEDKDRTDIILTDRFLETVESVRQPVYRRLPGKFNLMKRMRTRVKPRFPDWLLGVLEKVVNGKRRLRALLARWSEYLRGGGIVMNYRGYRLHYGAGNALIGRIRGGGMYEPETTTVLVPSLRPKRPGVIARCGCQCRFIVA